jgi:hypothetical protein
VREVSRLARLLLLSEGRGQSLWRDYTASQRVAAEEVEQWRHRTLEAEQRALESERRLAAAQALLSTRRARIGLTVGRTFDRLRRHG